MKNKLHEVLEYNQEDREKSASHNEIKILQRIGNIVVSHQVGEQKIYSEGFILDKKYVPARFTEVVGIGDSKNKISRKQVNLRKKKSKIFQRRRVDWRGLREENNDLGNLGEEFVLEYEQERVSTFDLTSVISVLHLSKLQGDGLGYDISSINDDGTIRRIEVKTTSGDLNTPFYMSENEKLFFETYKDESVYLYRVYEFDKLTRRGR